MKHDWKMRGDDIDIFAYEEGDYHNGPRCKRCGKGVCRHCEPECYSEECDAVVSGDESR